MTHDPDLAALASTWKENDMTTLNLTFSPTRLAHTNRWEGRLTRVSAGLFGGSAVLVAGWGLLAHDPTRLFLGLFLVPLAVALARGSRGLRARARIADALLAGPPIDVVRGHRHLVHTRLCALRSPTALAITVAPVLLYAGLVMSGDFPPLFAVTSGTAYTSWLAWIHLHTVPTLRAEVARLDVLIEELGGE